MPINLMYLFVHLCCFSIIIWDFILSTFHLLGLIYFGKLLSMFAAGSRGSVVLCGTA